MATSETSPVVVTRIQNRRGLQAQFNGPTGGIYPYNYNGIGGFGSLPGYNFTTYPNVLMPGELALCTDTRRIFMGNLNGEYVEVTGNGSGELDLTPMVIQLPPTNTYTPISQLTYSGVPYLNLWYSLTDFVVPPQTTTPPPIIQIQLVDINGIVLGYTSSGIPPADTTGMYLLLSDINGTSYGYARTSSGYGMTSQFTDIVSGLVVYIFPGVITTPPPTTTLPPGTQIPLTDIYNVILGYSISTIPSGDVGGTYIQVFDPINTSYGYLRTSSGYGMTVPITNPLGVVIGYAFP